MPIPKDESTGPTLMITLLLTTGARHPFKIDPKYLSKRNVDVQESDPFNLSVYKLKELILREWRDGMATYVPENEGEALTWENRMGTKAIQSQLNTIDLIWKVA